MGELIKKKEDLEKELSKSMTDRTLAAQMLQTKEEELESAKAALVEAQRTLDYVTEEYNYAKMNADDAELYVRDVTTLLKKINTEIEELSNKVYLVEPWHIGPLPEYGTCISTAPIEGCTQQTVPEEYMPEMSVEGILLFDFIPDYKVARKFVGLIKMFEGKKFTLLVGDERLQRLMAQCL